eukprot:Clim_evm9s231 gene=Clim_evmTU9s231
MAPVQAPPEEQSSKASGSGIDKGKARAPAKREREDGSEDDEVTVYTLKPLPKRRGMPGIIEEEKRRQAELLQRISQLESEIKGLEAEQEAALAEDMFMEGEDAGSLEQNEGVDRGVAEIFDSLLGLQDGSSMSGTITQENDPFHREESTDLQIRAAEALSGIRFDEASYTYKRRATDGSESEDASAFTRAYHLAGESVGLRFDIHFTSVPGSGAVDDLQIIVSNAPQSLQGFARQVSQSGSLWAFFRALQQYTHFELQRRMLWKYMKKRDRELRTNSSAAERSSTTRNSIVVFPEGMQHAEMAFLVSARNHRRRMLTLRWSQTFDVHTGRVHPQIGLSMNRDISTEASFRIQQVVQALSDRFLDLIRLKGFEGAAECILRLLRAVDDGCMSLK